MRKSLPVILVLLLATPTAIRADGCKFRWDGRTVPEREQRALIEWDNGVETLHVAALSDPTADANVWIVPIRAAASAIKAEPVEEFPAVVYYETLRSYAIEKLRVCITVAALLDTGGLCCPFLGGSGSSGGFGCSGRPASEIEVSRVEKLGMIVTVISAKSRRQIENYLAAQGVNHLAADLSSLEPYFGREGYAFVCGWVAKRGEPVAATGLKIEFPSPTMWFPLQATRSNGSAVETVVYVRGFVKPSDGCDLPELRCEYIYGALETKGVHQAFELNRLESKIRYLYSGHLERFTRVTLTTDAQQWDRDLELVPGTTSLGTVSLAVLGWPGFLAPLWSAMLGALLGSMIPCLTIPKPERLRRDWLAGAAIGGVIALSILASIVAFSLWRWLRFDGQPKKPTRFLVLPALAIVHFGIVWGVCRGLIAWIQIAN